MTQTAAFDIGTYAAAVFDLDGTVWLSEQPIPGAVEYVESCRAAGLTITFATNATFASVAQLHEALIRCGLGSRDDAVVTGGSVVAATLRELGVREVVAEVPPAMGAAIEAAGIVRHHADDAPAHDWGDGDAASGRAVVLGAYRTATFGNVERVGHLASLGYPLYVTSLEPGFPALGRIEPGGGMLVAAAQALYDVEPIVLGKPSVPYASAVRAAVRSLGPIVVFGDSQRADIGTASLLGADGVLVSSAIVRDDLASPHYVTARLGAEIQVYRRSGGATRTHEGKPT